MRDALTGPRLGRRTEVNYLEVIQFKWLEKLEMTELPVNTIMVHWLPSPA